MLGPRLISPPDDSSDEADGGKEVSGQPIVARRDVAEVFEAAEGVLDAVPVFVGFSVEAERLLSVRLVGNDGLGSALVQPLPQLGAVVGLIPEKLLCRLGPSDQALCERTIVRLTASQEEGKKTVFSICDCVDFRIAPASRAANSLLLFPLFAPEAERCALMCVESIICVFVDRPRAASSRNNLSHTPRSAQRTKRL